MVDLGQAGAIHPVALINRHGSSVGQLDIAPGDATRDRASLCEQ
jgi:hypothetical protein